LNRFKESNFGKCLTNLGVVVRIYNLKLWPKYEGEFDGKGCGSLCFWYFR